MHSKKIGTIYKPGCNNTIEIGPGRRISFRGGAAVVTDERDVVGLLSHEDMTLEIEHEYAERLPLWAAKVPVGRRACLRVTLGGDAAERFEIGPGPKYRMTPRDDGLAGVGAAPKPRGWKPSTSAEEVVI